ncbi:hypothetical protein BpHYR1_050581 [Brachionus plicatilis]|uniref:Uncharacterized protein n=1 Tax=Brachionus plicatilis TaxID=10195 RepID=A0A3M7S3Y0_BRAPC|nr:hypothetical protein BpHYR1_050581 [Brachionus plicatilis]
MLNLSKLRIKQICLIQILSRYLKTSKEIINENYFACKNINSTPSNGIPEKNLPLKKNKNKMKTTFLNTIDESNHKNSLKERARKYFKIDTPNVESRYGQEIFEESMFESSTTDQNAFHFEPNRQHFCHSIDYDHQSMNRFGNSDADYINCYPNGVQDFGRNFDSSQSSQVYWDLVKQDELHSYTNLAKPFIFKFTIKLIVTSERERSI